MVCEGTKILKGGPRPLACYGEGAGLGDVGWYRKGDRFVQGKCDYNCSRDLLGALYWTKSIQPNLDVNEDQLPLSPMPRAGYEERAGLMDEVCQLM